MFRQKYNEQTFHLHRFGFDDLCREMDSLQSLMIHFDWLKMNL
ncbi:hypothetical protein C943_02797 [Mariniradius saccharolyticus AK6]|uniref:Uncharacterized protein n=1 Tax=Mariniradius saccharolyticus AK6 TaxID=1239962 RepID=M7X091_9BACT|nr:hypothetical protein C943_02797 [Mariniradius saccharolyticus AK6]